MQLGFALVFSPIHDYYNCRNHAFSIRVFWVIESNGKGGFQGLNSFCYYRFLRKLGLPYVDSMKFVSRAETHTCENSSMLLKASEDSSRISETQRDFCEKESCLYFYGEGRSSTVIIGTRK